MAYRTHIPIVAALLIGLAFVPIAQAQHYRGYQHQRQHSDNTGAIIGTIIGLGVLGMIGAANQPGGYYAPPPVYYPYSGYPTPPPPAVYYGTPYSYPPGRY